MKKNENLFTTENSVLLASAKGVCPICSLVRSFQNELIERLQPNWASTVCNYHAWAIAASSPASSVTEVFLTMLRETSIREASGECTDCDLCWSIREHEAVRLREFAAEMKRNRFAEWLARYGTLCRLHGATLQSMLPEEYAQVVSVVMKNNHQELEKSLMEFADKTRRGEHGGGGVLGRTAEFLVSQRGLRR
jgi:ferredoxin